ncbi:protein containing RNA-directed DNA polymerase (reverse transcriptase) domain protein, partial [gut metagenome]
MTTAKSVRRVIAEGAWMVTLDLKSAYWHVPIHPKFQPLLGFKIEDQAYQFRAMPFGLNIAPRVFTKLCSVIIKELRIRGILIFAYLDDWIIWTPSYKLCLQALETVCKVIQKYGFIINKEKSIFVPTQ